MNTVINSNAIDDSESNDEVKKPAESGIEGIDKALMITFVSGICVASMKDNTAIPRRKISPAL